MSAWPRWRGALVGGWSLRGRLTAWLFLVIVVATTTQAWISYRLVLSEVDAMFDYQIEQMARALQDTRGMQSIGGVNPSDGLEDFAFVVNLRSPDGRMLVSNGPIHLPAGTPSGFSESSAEGEVYRVFTRRGEGNTIQVAQESESRRELAAGIALRSLWPTLMFAMAVLFCVLLVVSRGLRPLTNLREQLVSRQPDDLQPLVETGLPVELQPMVRETNALIARMQATYEVQRRFVADAAHELRTPLAAIQLQGDVVQRAETPEQRASALARQREGVARATHLIEQLLTLARRDAKREPSFAQTTSVFDIVRQAIADREPRIQAREIDVTAELGNAEWLGVPLEPLRIIVGNLVDNATSYCNESGRVRITARLRERVLLICVEDSGPGIPPDQRDRVLDRFYRLPGSRAFGSGLGLSIVVRALAELDGRLELTASPELGGLAATCHIPWPSTEKLPA